MNENLTTDHAPGLSRRLGFAGLAPVTLNLLAYGCLTISTLQSVTAGPDDWFAGMTALIWAGLFGVVGLVWSLISVIVAFIALARPTRNPLGRPNGNDRRDAMAILIASAAPILIWELIIAAVIATQ
jgi:hypothetical protein